MIWCDIIEVRLGLNSFIFGVVWCLMSGLVWFLLFFQLIDVLLCDFGVIWFWIIRCDIIDVRLGLICFVFGVIWCLLMWFSVICIILGGSQWFLVWFGCDLFLNDLVWYYWGQVRSDFISCWCSLVSYVWFGVIFTFFSVNPCFVVWFWCDLVLNYLVW